MVYWISLEPGWKLQDVQAGLNVAIAFVCAGSIFVLVRYCWLLAARKVTQEKDVPASSLLSLNTIGETIDVIWLLRKELFTRRYYGLLLQCIGVILLTIAALLSGFIARFSTRYGTIVMDRMVNGTIAGRLTGSIQYAEVDTNATLYSLKNAGFPQTQLLEYLPNLGVRWEYVPEQWNSSWKMACAYNESVEVPNVVTTGNCTSLLSEVPQIADNWQDWNDQWWYQPTGWRNNYTMYRDVLIFSHGVDWNASDKALDTWTSARVRTVALHMEGVPYNTSIDNSDCAYAEGPVQRARYTSMTCQLTRDTKGKTKDELYWGAYPDAYDLSIQSVAYLQHYGNNFRKQSSREEPITPFTGRELAMFYQAYMVTKDTSNSPYTERKMSVHVQVPQLSIVTLVICSLGAAIVLFGLFHYWIFLFRNWNLMNKTPQSKLDWMLRTLRMEGDDHQHSSSMRTKLREAMASGQHNSEVVPLNNVTSSGQYHDRKRSRSTASSTITFPTPEMDSADDGFETPILGANFSGTRPGASWYPQVQAQPPQQQYHRVGSVGNGHGHGRQASFGLGLDYGRSSGSPYSAVPQTSGRAEGGRSSKVWVGTHHVDTIYDPGRW